MKPRASILVAVVLLAGCAQIQNLTQPDYTTRALVRMEIATLAVDHSAAVQKILDARDRISEAEFALAQRMEAKVNDAAARVQSLVDPWTPDGPKPGGIDEALADLRAAVDDLVVFSRALPEE